MHRRMKKKACTPSDLDRTAVYCFGHARPGQADGFGPAWLVPATSAHSVFFSVIWFFLFANPC
jgi:hypothetical protein